MLGDHPRWRHSKVLKFAGDTGRKYHPLSFLELEDLVNKIFTKELHVLLTGFMGSSLDGLIDALMGPRIHFELDGHTYVLVQLQETSCWMMNIAKIC